MPNDSIQSAIHLWWGIRSKSYEDDDDDDDVYKKSQALIASLKPEMRGT